MYKFQRLTHNGFNSISISKVNFTGEYDAVIVGGGTAGSMAAAYLADKNYKILIIEKMQYLGGMHTSGMFAYYMGSTGGLYEDFDKNVKEMEGLYNISKTYGSQPLCRMHIYEQYFIENHVEISFDSIVTGVYIDGRKMIGIQFLKDDCLVNIRSRIFLDASGDAVLSRIAGNDVKIGRSYDQLCQPFSNVRIYYDLRKDRIEINNIDAGYMNYMSFKTYSDNIINSYLNPAYENKSKEEITLGMSPILGIRESYRIKGIEELSMQNVLYGIPVKEPLFYTGANIDNHAKDMAFESEALCDWNVAMSLWGVKVSLPIRKEYMLLDNLDNVIAAGRILSLDHDVASHSRMMRDCQKSGEAAGILIHAALRHNTILKNTKYKNIINELKSHNCLLETNNFKMKDNPPPDRDKVKKFPVHKSDIRLSMISDAPGYGMLKAYRNGDKEILKVWLQENNRNLEFNSAVVLALLGDDCGYKVLLETAKNRDPYLPKTSKSYNALRGVTAVYALGKLQKEESIMPLLRMFRNHNDFFNDTFTEDKLISSKEDYHFQYVSHIVRALLNISLYTDNKKIIEELKTIINLPSFNVCCTLKSNKKQFYDMKGTLLKYIEWRISIHEREE